MPPGAGRAEIAPRYTAHSSYSTHGHTASHFTIHTATLPSHFTVHTATLPGHFTVHTAPRSRWRRKPCTGRPSFFPTSKALPDSINGFHAFFLLSTAPRRTAVYAGKGGTYAVLPSTRTWKRAYAALPTGKGTHRIAVRTDRKGMRRDAVHTGKEDIRRDVRALSMH